MKNYHGWKINSIFFGCLLFGLFSFPASLASGTFQETEPKKELTIKDVMNAAHKKGLVKKVATDKASAEEKKSLLEMYKALTKRKPPKGDQASWDAKTKAMVAAAKLAVQNDAEFKAKLKAATNCTECHKLHK